MHAANDLDGHSWMMQKRYDRAYFDKWYRHPRHAVASPRELDRKVALAVATAEYYLGRRIVNVLDVACGEGVWRAPLKRLRPSVEYLGLDSSEYAIARYGRSRNLRLAKFGDLEHLRFERRFDLVVCSDALHYVRTPELRRGLRGLARRFSIGARRGLRPLSATTLSSPTSPISDARPRPNRE